jgi:hypothetical protein
MRETKVTSSLNKPTGASQRLDLQVIGRVASTEAMLFWAAPETGHGLRCFLPLIVFCFHDILGCGSSLRWHMEYLPGWVFVDHRLCESPFRTESDFLSAE